MSLQLVFAYGTLRPGEYNHFQDCFVDAVDDCVTPGMMVDNGAYPYACFEVDHRTVNGTLFLADTDSELFRSIRQMELHAGYDEVTIAVQMPSGSSVDAIAWGLPIDDSRLHRYPLVESGDWRKRDMLTPRW